MDVSTFYRPEQLFSEAAQQITLSVVMRDKQALAEGFYAHMLRNPQAAHFLSPEVIQNHLKPGLQRWLIEVFSVKDEATLGNMLKMQRHVGEVHARVEIPVGLVAQGIRLLKYRLKEALLTSDAPESTRLAAILRVDALLDIALEEMSHAFVASHARHARIDEAYKIVAAGQNLSLERERQLAALLEWENRLFRALATGQSTSNVCKLSEAPFGLWLHHKASLLFDQSQESPKIDAMLQRVDEQLLPALSVAETQPDGTAEKARLVRELATEIEQIGFLLGELFDRFTGLEVGRDAMTQLFNRRFLTTILRHEIELHRKRQDQFSLLMLDIDHFKTINDEFGHDAGDKVIQHVAATLLSLVRAGDFVFRFGGEEFLILLTEVAPLQALAVAEKIRHRIGQTPIALGDSQTTVTLSIGIAHYDGHPDYQKLINRADTALYDAKHQGRNCCVESQSANKT